MRKPKSPSEKVQRFLADRKAGMSIISLSKKYNYTLNSVYATLGRYKVKSPNLEFVSVGVRKKILRAYNLEAEKRNVFPRTLMAQILTLTIEENLLTAILDDGEENDN